MYLWGGADGYLRDIKSSESTILSFQTWQTHRVFNHGKHIDVRIPVPGLSQNAFSNTPQNVAGSPSEFMSSYFGDLKVHPRCTILNYLSVLKQFDVNDFATFYRFTRMGKLPGNPQRLHRELYKETA